jgi:hypothetical protein
MISSEGGMTMGKTVEDKVYTLKLTEKEAGYVFRSLNAYVESGAPDEVFDVVYIVYKQLKEQIGLGL